VLDSLYLVTISSGISLHTLFPHTTISVVYSEVSSLTDPCALRAVDTFFTGRSLEELLLLADGPGGVPAGDDGTFGGKTDEESTMVVTPAVRHHIRKDLKRTVCFHVAFRVSSLLRDERHEMDGLWSYVSLENFCCNMN